MRIPCFEGDVTLRCDAQVQEGYPVVEGETHEETKNLHVFMERFATGVPKEYTTVTFGKVKCASTH